MAFQFRADPRNGYDVGGGDPCGLSCCCSQANAVPGETNGWSINYLPWVALLGGRGLTNPTQLAIIKLTPATSAPSTPIGDGELIVDAFGTVIGDIPGSSTPTVGASSSDGLISVPQNRISIRGNVLSFPLVVSPLASVGDLYRLTVRQVAMDCGASFFAHVSCYDIAIVRC